MKEAPESLLAPSTHIKTRQEVSSLQPKSGPLPEPNYAGTLILNFQPLVLFISHPAYGIFVIAPKTDK